MINTLKPKPHSKCICLTASEAAELGQALIFAAGLGDLGSVVALKEYRGKPIQ